MPIGPKPPRLSSTPREGAGRAGTSRTTAPASRPGMPADLSDQPASRSAARAGLGVLEGGGAGPCGLSGGLGGAVGTVGRSVCDSVRGGAFGAGGSELPGEGTEAAPRPAGTGGLAVPAADVDPGSRALVDAGAGGRCAGRECYSMPRVALRPGWAWCHGSTGREARRGSARSPSMATATSGATWCRARSL